tara:strand:- start:7445 stop:7696 length:252 start_codon:yes stop_codon:yes gene_type:complete
MILTKKSAGAVVTGLAGLILTLSSPHFELKDIPAPVRVIQKIKYNDKYNGSGLAYNLSYAALGASLLGLGYNGLTGNFKRKED